MGFPIRKSADQSLFAAPHGLSQRTTSFIASQRQGIHRTPLWHLIALIIDAHRSAAAYPRMSPKNWIFRISLCANNVVDRKTICFEHIRERCGQATPTWVARAGPKDRRDRICFLFTMTDNTHRRMKRLTRNSSKDDERPKPPAPRRLVEPDGIEPTTSCLQSTRSPN